MHAGVGLINVTARMARCLLAGDAYNLHVIFRLCQLWFSLGADPKVAEQMAKAAGEVPSWKFMPLVYQLASRLSCGGRSRPHDDSGFTVSPATDIIDLPLGHWQCSSLQCTVKWMRCPAQQKFLVEQFTLWLYQLTTCSTGSIRLQSQNGCERSNPLGGIFSAGDAYCADGEADK